ncbi:MAG: hypothetical protein IPI31_02435 [Bacteroidetes bacterium]|nr:hypothetical protein [Bacteroidota bacterium]
MKKYSLLFGFSLFILINNLAAQVAGDLDTTFDFDGTLIFNFTEGGNGASSMVLQPDGKIVIGGGAITDVFTDFALLRFNMNGSLDTTFGDMGIMVTSIGPFNDFCHSLALQEDGKIVAIGHTYLNSIGSETICALARYLPDGSPDPDFGDDGIITTDIGPNEQLLHSAAIQADGKIVAAGYSGDMGNHAFAVLRYLENGELDNDFNDDGILTFGLGAGTASANAIVIQPENTILVGGFAHNGTDDDFVLFRLDTAGIFDMDFGIDGVVVSDFFEKWNRINAIAIQPDGKIVAAGYSGEFPEYDFAVARYYTDGTIDSSFNFTGLRLTDLGSGNDIAESVIIQPDGKIVAAGSFLTASYQYALIRYTSDGLLDNSFNDDGIVTTNIPGVTSEQLNIAAWQPDGKIICAGGGMSGGEGYFTMARYIGRLQESCDSIDVQPMDIDTIADSDVFFFIGGAADTAEYQWQTNLGLGWTDLFDAGQYMGVNDDTLYVININELNNNQLFRCLINNLDCKDTSEHAILTVNDQMGIGNIISGVNFILYPNPITENAQLDYTLLEEETLSIYLYNRTGKLITSLIENKIYQAGSYKQKIIIPSFLSSGNYDILIITKNDRLLIPIYYQHQ